MLGIELEAALDVQCSNFVHHSKLGKQHVVNRAEFLNLIQAQLSENLDHNFEPLDMQGARGALFKVALESHGYVFVGKGTVWTFVPDLIHEEHICERMKPLQGTAIPVYLGNMDLLEWYNLDFGTRILHMMFMSYGGQCILDGHVAKTLPSATLQAEIARTKDEVRRCGVDQQDYREPNFF